MDRPDGPWTEEALTRLWREHRRWVGAVLLAHAPRGSDVDDLLQEVAMALVRNIDKLTEDSVAPWLRTVAVNAARTVGRRTSTARRALGEREPLESVAAAPALRLVKPFGGSEPVNEEARARGRAALGVIHGLPAEYREPLLLSLRGLSHKQIGLVLDLPTSTIETRLFRARAMVREELLAHEAKAGGAAGPYPLHKMAGSTGMTASGGGGSP